MILAAIFNFVGVPGLSILFQVIGYIIGPCLPFQQGLYAFNPSSQGNLFGLVLIKAPGVIIAILFLQAIVYMVLTSLVEHRQLNKIRKMKNESTTHDVAPRRSGASQPSAS